MSPYQMAKMECANYVGQGCIINDKCKLAAKPLKRCVYFEKCVLGMPLQPDADKNPRYPEYLVAMQQYQGATATRVTAVKLRVCECGQPLAKRQRVCVACAKKRRRESNRQAQLKRRMSVSS